MNALHKHVTKSKAKPSKYNNTKNNVNYEKPLILQQIVETNKVNNTKKKKK